MRREQWQCGRPGKFRRADPAAGPATFAATFAAATASAATSGGSTAVPAAAAKG